MSELALKLIKEAKEQGLMRLKKSIKEAKEQGLKRLDLDDLSIESLPNEMSELTLLEELQVRRCYDLHNIDALKACKNLRTLDVSDTEVTDLSPIKDLVNLQDLNISKTKINSLEFIKNLKNLRTLKCGKTNLTDLNGIEELQNLETLQVEDTQIVSLALLENIVSLSTLSIANTQVHDLNPLRKLEKLWIFNAQNTPIKKLNPLENLLGLDDINISDTKVKSLVGLENLKGLKYLYASNTAIKNLKPLKGLTKLRDLNISGTNVEDLSPLKGLPDLGYLWLERMKMEMKTLSPLSEISKLEYLNVSSNPINENDLIPIKDLPNLRTLDISSTQVSDLRVLKNFFIKTDELLLSKSMVNNTLVVTNCPLTTPPLSIFQNGKKAILSYFNEIENKETITNNQTKLIFVGNSRAGKTSLWQFLNYKTFDKKADSTHGIKTEIWDKETLGIEDNQNLAAHIWDFGGQEYYHATHRLFLADNAVYVLVWERESNKQGTRLEKFKLDDDPNGEIEEVELEHFPASYWLENIRYFGDKHCPVLIVQNKVDSEDDYRSHTEGDDESWRCFHISVKNAYNFQQGNQSLKRFDIKFQDFKETLLDVLRKSINPKVIVKYYVQVREKLEDLSKSIEYITPQQLRKIALEFDDTPDMGNLLAYLSANSTILYFPKFERLKERLYLKPTQVSKDIYKILNKEVQKNNGRFNFEHIQKRLNCDETEVERFIDLMKAFDLIFEKTNSENKRLFVAPQYLLPKEKLGLNSDTIIRVKTAFYIRFYKFTPPSMMSRFIAHNGHTSMDENYWKNGIIYYGKQTNLPIRVEFDHSKGIFKIDVQNKELQVIDMQNIVNKFVELDGSSENIEISLDSETFIDFDKLRLMLERGDVNGLIYSADGKTIDKSEYKWLTQKIETEPIMDLKGLKNTVHGFIAKAKTKEAMEAVATWAHANNREPLKSDINQLKGELVALDRQETLGLLSFQEVSREKAKLNHRLMNLMNGIDESSTKDSEGIRVDDTPTPPVTPQVNVSAKLKILMLTANPANTAIINLKKEHSLITLKLQNTQDTFNLILREAVSASEFKEFIETEQPAILHFSGHGEGGKDGGIVVQNDDKNDEELISIDGLDALFEYLKDELNIHIKAVLLNACYSEQQALTIAKYVDYVVGTTVELGDDLAIAFSTGYYFKLATSNLDFELSFKSGRTQAVMKGASKSHFVLYKNGEKSIV